MSSKGWRFKLGEDYEYSSELLTGIVFENEFVKISDSKITISKNYAWDGCSPSYKVNIGSLLPQGLWFGTWDGPLDINAMAVSHYASLVHDALCQFKFDIDGMTKANAVKIFKELLILGNAPKWMITLYPLAVYCFGPQRWK